MADGEPGDLSRSLSGSHRMLLRVVGPEDGILAVLSTLPGVQSVDSLGTNEENAYDFSLEPREGMDIRSEVFFALAEKKWPLLSMRSNELSLEEIFLRLTTGYDARTDAEEASDNEKSTR